MMIRAYHPALRFGEIAFDRQPLRLLKGFVSAYPEAERCAQRVIRPKLAELYRHYRLPFERRLGIAHNRLANTLPYYRDLFAQHHFDSEKVRNDTAYLNELPYLTKDIIRELDQRMLSQPLAEIRHHFRQTGGSTGVSMVIYSDQETIDDYSAAVMPYARERIGKKKYKSKLHFACRFPDPGVPQRPSHEDWKCFAMNRSNIFFDLIDDAGTEVIWSKLKRRCPYLAHELPSTIYALACYIERKFSTIRHRTRWLRRPTPAIVAASMTLSAMIHNFFWHGAAPSPIFHKVLSDTDSSAYCTVTAC